MAIYPATYLANVLIADDGYTAVQVSSSLVSYNEFLMSCYTTKPQIFGVNMYCQTQSQLNEPMMQIMGTTRGENDAHMIRTVPNENLLQAIGSAEYEKYVVAQGNEIKYRIQPSQTVIKEVFTGMGVDDVFAHDNALQTDAMGTQNNYVGGVTSERQYSPIEKLIQAEETKENLELIEQINISLKQIANIKPQPSEEKKKQSDYRPMSSFMFFNSLFLKVKKGQKTAQLEIKKQ